MVPSLAGTSHHAPWPEDALTGSVLRPRSCGAVGDRGVRSPASTLAGIATHYETLGVGRNASVDEIRAAYLERARRHHPDVAVGDQRSTSAAMAELNRAYHVLRRPERRAHYDRELDAPAAASTTGPTTAAPPSDVDDAWTDDESRRRPPSRGSRTIGRIVSPPGPARMPWKSMAVAAVVGSVVIIASAALIEAPEDEPPDGILRVGSCVEVEANTDVREVACGPDAELVVRLVIPTSASCPAAYLAYRDRLGLGRACVEPIGATERGTG